MSALNDNKTFLSGVLSGNTLNFDKEVFGLWVSVFQHVNYSQNGYSHFQPLVRDITSVNFSITGKKFSLLNFDGKYADAKFIITSGSRGSNELETTEIVADISDSFVSGYNPLVIMPTVDFAGSIYKRTEITGEKKSIGGNYNLLSLSGEDWGATAIPVHIGDGTEEYSHFDATYSGYSNEVATRYKFLYNDSSKSIDTKTSSFEIPIKLEQGSTFKYRVSRKSDPLGSYYTPDITTDGKIVIDYSIYKDEVSKPVQVGLNYNFDTVSRLSFPLGVFEDLNNNEVVIRKINDTSITGLKLSKSTDDAGNNSYQFYLLSTGSEKSNNHDGVYKLTFNLDRYNTSDKIGIYGYALTGVKTGDVSSDVKVDLAVNSGVYPRVIQTTIYNNSDISKLGNLEELIINEESAQELASKVDYEDKKNLAKDIEENIKNNISLLEELLNDGETTPTTEVDRLEAIDRRAVDDLEKSILNSTNSSPIIEKIALPKFSLPKENVDKDYYTNYINSGEEYVATPLSSYTSPLSYVYYGDQYGQLGYYIEAPEGRPGFRQAINSTSNGVFVSNTGVCKGDTAIFANMPYSEDVYFENGLCTAIPPNGAIEKGNYSTSTNWQNSINYFYSKNYLYSIDIFPSNTDQQIINSISNGISKANANLGSPLGSFILEDPQVKDAIIYLEREIYVEAYDQQQTKLLNNTINSGSFSSPDAELTIQKIEKLYCVQIFDTSDFPKNNAGFFNKAVDYQENIKFKSFSPYLDSAGALVTNYSTGEDFGSLHFNDTNKGDYLYRLEYVTGSAFSYNATSAFRAWNGLAGGTISILNQDEKNYGYHLYAYNSATSTLNFIKSNVLNSEAASIGALSNAVVLKFNKQGFTNSSYLYQPSDNISYTAFNTTVVDSSGELVSPSNVFFNIQKYEYETVDQDPTRKTFWFTNKENPINNDSYGADDQLGLLAPRFFEDASDEAKSAAEQLLVFPNGPSTSKNYEGSRVTLGGDLNCFAQGLLNNKLTIKEQSKNSYLIENDFVLNFTSRGRVTKEEGVPNNKNFNESRRLKIARVRYNFYSKNLLVIGDAGFPYALAFNSGWEYKLQYKKSLDSEWKEMPSSSELDNNNIEAVGSFLNPYFYKKEDLSVPNYLPMIGFLTNLSSFLDDSQYQFRIFKYEKFDSPSDSVNIIRKTNFLPVKVNWQNDGKSSYFDIYQLDSGNNLKLIQTEVDQKSFAYAVPNVKQQYFNLGIANFPKNGSGYYDIVVSGALPSLERVSADAGSIYSPAIVIGNSSADPNSVFDKSGPVNVNVVAQISNGSGFNSIGGVSYSPLIDFNNPESKNSDFEIDGNYNGYYFVTSGKMATIAEALDNGFECYVANTGSNTSIINIGAATSLNTNKVATINYPSIDCSSSIVSLPSPQVEVVGGSELDPNYIYIKESINYNTGDFPSVDETLKTSYSSIINDSNSPVTVNYSSESVSIPANTSRKLSFTNGWNESNFNPSITELYSYSNLNIQTDHISSSTGLVNLNYDSLILENKDYSNLPIYNFAKNRLSVNGLVDDLNSDSFYLVNGNPSAGITAVEKSSFDYIKIYLTNDEAGDKNIFVLKDDTDINLSNFAPNGDATKDYFFIKDNSITRVLNINVINGNEKYLVPKSSQDFKLTVSKTNSGITYSILFPASDFSTVISSALEQIIVLKSNNNGEIDIGYIEASLKSSAFVYFVNASSNSYFTFQRNFSNVMTLSPLEVARVSLEKFNKTARIVKINEAKNHFEFSINGDLHLNEVSGVNILNLKFCNSDITLPQVSDFNGKETFIISKNRLAANRSNQDKLQNDFATKAVNEAGFFQSNCVVSRIYKDSNSSTYPSLSQIEMVANRGEFSEAKTPTDQKYNIFYVKDPDLNSFSIKDYFERTKSYYGKVLINSDRQFSIYSYDENTSFPSKEGCSFDFDFDLGDVVDGALTIKKQETDYQIINSASEDIEGKTLNTLQDGQLCVNFAYENITITAPSVSLVKNRIAFFNQRSIQLAPIYNKDEFFIAQNIDGNKRANYTYENSFFYLIDSSFDARSVVLPYSSNDANKYIVENLSSRPVQVSDLNSNSLILTLNPNEKKTFSYSNSWVSQDYNSSTDGTLAEKQAPLIINYENQYSEIDPSHPLLNIWESQLTTAGVEKSVIEAFSFIEGAEQQSVILTETEKMFVDLDINGVGSSGNFIFCYGRGGLKEISGDKSVIVNDFYLYIKYKNAPIYRNNVGGEFLNNEIIKSDSQYYHTIERKHFDLLNTFFKDKFSNIARSLRSATAIPFYNELQTYYLPNLSTTINKLDPEVDDPSLGSLWVGKKFVFINLVKINAEAPNKIYNYSDQLYTSVTKTTGNDAIAIFEVVLNGASYIWKKQSLNIPSVQNVHPTLKNVKGVSQTASSNTANGDEFVYLSNFNTFKVSIESFSNYTFDNFYLYNSCNYPISILLDGVALMAPVSGPFLKVEYDKISNLAINQSNNFAETPLANTTLDKLPETINSIYKEAADGSYAKLNYNKGASVDKAIKTALFKRSSSVWEEMDLSDYVGPKNCVDLDIANLEKYDPDSRLFIYGSSVRNQFSQAFDPYTLRITNVSGRSTPFFIFNNTAQDLTIAVGGIENYNILLAKGRLAQIYKKEGISFFSVLETHQRGRYFLSNKKSGISYIHSNESEIFFEALRDFALDNTGSYPTQSEDLNCLLNLLSKNSKYTKFYYNSYDAPPSSLLPSDPKGVSIENFITIPLKTTDDFSQLAANPGDGTRELRYPFYGILSAGHYIFNLSNYSVNVPSGLTGVFLVNNTSKDIRVIQGESSATLFRNTVYLINGDSKRYLKKGKSKNEFYAVFNPKTIINTQREISLNYDIPKHLEILPIYDIDFIDIPSYLKLYSRYGETQSVYLSFDNYFLGKDIPSDCPKNMVAYEVGVGHETIYKFLFFDPSTNYYTLPGITSGVEYMVDFDDGFFANLLIGEEGSAAFGGFKYMGKKYKNGETFFGASSSWYEVDCPDYVRVQKITREMPAGFDDFYAAEKDSDIDDANLASLDADLQVPDDPLSSLKEAIFKNISNTLSTLPATETAVCWIPESQNAFWLDSNFTKDIWEVDEITSSDTKKIISGSQEVSFVKCKFKKIGSRFLINSFFFNFHSALQEKLKMSEIGQISMGFDYNLKPSQKNALNKTGQIVYSQNDYIFSDKEFLFAKIPQEDIIPSKSEGKSSVIKKADIEVTVTIEKLKTMPELRIEDYSSDPVINLLNNKV
jgi:hypothetical protein